MSPCYCIRVSGRLGPEVSGLLHDLAPRPDGDATVLLVTDADQAKLHGTLGRLRDLGIEIESVVRENAAAS